MSHEMFAPCLSERGFRKQKTKTVIVYHGIGLFAEEVHDPPAGRRWLPYRDCRSELCVLRDPFQF